MALPSIDTYLYDEIESKLKIILENRYIIEEILKGVQPDIAANFIKAYTGDNAKEIPIVYTMPQTKEKQQGAIYIGLREGEEDHTSLGNIEGTYAQLSGGLKQQTITIEHDESRNTCYFEVDFPIDHVEVVKGVSFAESDRLTTDGNRVDFTYDPYFVGKEFSVIYEATAGDEIGLKKGFTATEQYAVMVVSTNMNTVRCLDLIVKAILIMMRNSPEENTIFLLQKIVFGQLEEQPVGAEETPEILYGRMSIITYTTSYSLDMPILDDVLKYINLNINYDLKGELRSGGKEKG